MYKVFAGSSVILVVVFFITVVDDYARDWKGVQKKFYRMELNKAEDDRQKEFAKSRKVEIKQIMVDGHGEVDRCMTCHLGAEDARFAEAEEPYKTHPNPDQGLSDGPNMWPLGQMEDLLRLLMTIDETVKQQGFASGY